MFCPLLPMGKIPLSLAIQPTIFAPVALFDLKLIRLSIQELRDKYPVGPSVILVSDV
jgi:hypothetical protein